MSRRRWWCDPSWDRFRANHEADEWLVGVDTKRHHYAPVAPCANATTFFKFQFSLHCYYDDGIIVAAQFYGHLFIYSGTEGQQIREMISSWWIHDHGGGDRWGRRRVVIKISRPIFRRIIFVLPRLASSSSSSRWRCNFSRESRREGRAMELLNWFLPQQRKWPSHLFIPTTVAASNWFSKFQSTPNATEFIKFISFAFLRYETTNVCPTDLTVSLAIKFVLKSLFLPRRRDAWNVVNYL